MAFKVLTFLGSTLATFGYSISRGKVKVADALAKPKDPPADP